MYKVKWKRTDLVTGEVTEGVVPKRYKTYRGAENKAKEYRWLGHRPHEPPTERCEAEVVEV